MKLNAEARIISALVIGAAFGAVVHFHQLSQLRAGRDAFLAAEALRFDHIDAKHSLGPLIFVAVLAAVAVFGVYELISWVVTKMLQRVVEERSAKGS